MSLAVIRVQASPTTTTVGVCVADGEPVTTGEAVGLAFPEPQATRSVRPTTMIDAQTDD